MSMVPGFRRDDVWTPAFAGVTVCETFCEVVLFVILIKTHPHKS